MSQSFENDVIEDVRAWLLDKLDGCEGLECYGSDLASMLMEEEYATGSITCDRQAAYSYIMAHPTAAATTAERLRELGTSIDPFSEPERFHIVMYEEAVEGILSLCQIIDANWNDSFVLEGSTRAALMDQVRAVRVDDVER